MVAVLKEGVEEEMKGGRERGGREAGHGGRGGRM